LEIYSLPLTSALQDRANAALSIGHINGERLARLMIRHGVGVRDRVSYVIRSVDEDYFSDPEG
jgi:restriction endonuclease Mrr